MRDAYGREIDYLRISITDRCNLRCRYCMPDGIETVSMSEILTFEEIERTVRAAAELGIRKIKITGGEPLGRRGSIGLIKTLKQISGIEQVTMTTNGVVLAETIDRLKDAGLDAVNISLDTLKPERFLEITGRDDHAAVMAGIEAACNAGIRTKINTVLQKDMNADEWKDIAELARKYPVDVRFIELMPIGSGKPSNGVNNEELEAMLKEAYPDMTSDDSVHGNGPAVYMHIPGFLGSIGFISAMHGKFCADCNRVRLTSEGKLKPCLCYGETIDLREVLRAENSTDEMLRQTLAAGISNKPQAHCFEQESEITEKRKMSSIGG